VRVSVYDHLEFRHLIYIIAVAETGSFTAAAQVCMWRSRQSADRSGGRLSTSIIFKFSSALSLLLHELERRFPVAGMQRPVGSEERQKPAYSRAFLFAGEARKPENQD
jgi:hypothetical protein